MRLLEVRLREKELVVFAESAAWAGRLKLALAELTAAGPVPGLPELRTDTRLVLKLMPREGFRRSRLHPVRAARRRRWAPIGPLESQIFPCAAVFNNSRSSLLFSPWPDL